MKGPLTRVSLLAVASIAGLVGMLVLDQALGDGVLFLVAALPLAYGGWSLWRESRADPPRN